VSGGEGGGGEGVGDDGGADGGSEGGCDKGRDGGGGERNSSEMTVDILENVLRKRTKRFALDLGLIMPRDGIRLKQ